MSYVFVPSPPSEKAERLGDALVGAIQEFRRTDPDLKPTDIQQALRIAGQKTGAGQAQTVILALVAGVLLLLGLLFFWLQSGR